MPKINADKKGIAIYLVLGAVIMAIVLAKIILNIILNQTSVTHHRLSRIQAYYASLAGINYALEMLKTGQWKMGTDCKDSAPCIKDFETANDFPASILNIAPGTTKKQFQIILCPKESTCAGLTCNTANLTTEADGCIYSRVKYTAP